MTLTMCITTMCDRNIDHCVYSMNEEELAAGGYLKFPDVYTEFGKIYAKLTEDGAGVEVTSRFFNGVMKTGDSFSSPEFARDYAYFSMVVSLRE